MSGADHAEPKLVRDRLLSVNAQVKQLEGLPRTMQAAAVILELGRLISSYLQTRTSGCCWTARCRLDCALEQRA